MNYQFPAISITSSTPFTFRLSDVGLPPNFTLSFVEVFVVAGSPTVYVGWAPPPSVTGTLNAPVSTMIGKSHFPKAVFAPDIDRTQGWDDIMPGYVFYDTDNNADDGLFVLSRNPKYLQMSGNFTHDPGGTFTGGFNPPDVLSTTGIPIAAGTGKAWVCDKDNRFLDHTPGLKFAVASSTATLHLQYGIR